MANNIAFQPMGKTVKVVATGAANTESAAFTITADSPVNQYYISNDKLITLRMFGSMLLICSM